PVQADAFSFNGPLPSEFGLTIATTGTPTVIGPDFRSATITPENLPPDASVRVEILLLPDIRIDQDEVSRLVAEFTPSTLDIATSTGGISAHVSIITADATLTASGMQGRLSGQIEITSVFGASTRGSFSANANVSIVPLTSPGLTNVCDLVAASDLTVDIPGGLDELVQAVLPFVRPALTGALTDHLRAVLPDALVAEVTHALVLPNLPPDVTVSIRQLAIDASGVSFQ